jgi:predicted ABC-type ATPase
LEYIKTIKAPEMIVILNMLEIMRDKRKGDRIKERLNQAKNGIKERVCKYYY